MRPGLSALAGAAIGATITIWVRAPSLTAALCAALAGASVAWMALHRGAERWPAPPTPPSAPEPKRPPPVQERNLSPEEPEPGAYYMTEDGEVVGVAQTARPHRRGTQVDTDGQTWTVVHIERDPEGDTAYLVRPMSRAPRCR